MNRQDHQGWNRLVVPALIMYGQWLLTITTV